MKHIITTDVEWAIGFGAGSWRAYARINGQRTSMNCMHSHSRQDLAERCAVKHFTPTLAALPTAAITQLDDTLHEMSWTDEQGRLVTRRFHYLPEKETNQ